MAAAVGTMAKKTLGKLAGVGSVAGIALDVYGTVGSYTGARKEGASVPKALGEFASSAVINALLPTSAQLAYMGLTVGYNMIIGNAQATAEQQKQMKYTGSGYVGSGTFNMSNAGYTMRQRALSKMQASGQQINSVLGNEARNYISSSRKAW